MLTLGVLSIIAFVGVLFLTYCYVGFSRGLSRKHRHHLLVFVNHSSNVTACLGRQGDAVQRQYLLDRRPNGFERIGWRPALKEEI